MIRFAVIGTNWITRQFVDAAGGERDGAGKPPHAGRQC